MKTLKFNNREEWLEARRGKITGSRLKDIVLKRGTTPKIGYYELIAERLAVAADDESPMDRGTRLEEEALANFTEETGKKLDTSLIIWTRDDNDCIALSPDGVVEDSNETEAVEVKCLSSAKHIEALLTQKIPPEYEEQMIQYFIVNDALQTLYWVFYDPRIGYGKDFHCIEVRREDVQEKVLECLTYQRQVLEEVDDIVNQLTF